MVKCAVLSRWLLLLSGLALPGHLPAQGSATVPAPVEITVDLAHTLGPYKPVYAWFGYDEGNYTTMPDGRRLLRELHDLSPAPVTIRVHHLLTSGDGTPELKWSSTGVYHEDAGGRPVYDFHILDGIFDSFQAAGVRPMVELGFMPEDLAATVPGKPRPYQVHFPGSTIDGASNNPPKDYARWEELVREVTAHLLERYGRETVRQWSFEVWNEPDIPYWHGSAEDYWKLYDYAVAGVRAALPEAKVGGPATTSPRSSRAAAYLREFLEHADHGRSAATGGPVPLDFISFHAKGQPEIQGGAVTMSIARELQDADAGFQLVRSFPRFAHLPIILSEADPEGCAACSSKTNPANNYRNGTLYPSYTVVAYKALLELADRQGVDLLAMLSWSFEFEGRTPFEGFRELSTDGIDKPVLNFFRMAAQLGGERVATISSGAVPLETLLSSGVRSTPDVDALATADAGHRSAAVMLWNYRDEQAAGAQAAVALRVGGMPSTAKHVTASTYVIDDTHSNAYTLWQAMGSPQHPTPDQLAKLRAGAGLQPLGPPQKVNVQAGAVRMPLTLESHAVALVLLHW